MKKLLTITMVTANRPKEFRKALESIQKLSYQDFELIVADDSQDDSAEKITKKLFPHATYFRNSPPLREILNSNKCISLAKTEYVALFHDDDMYEPEYFTQMMDIIAKDKRIDIAYTGKRMINEHDEQIALQVAQTDTEIYLYDGRTIVDDMLLGKKDEQYRIQINTPGLVMRKSLFMKVKGFDNKINTHCDTDLLLKLLSLSDKVLFINKPLFNNRIWQSVSGRTKSSERGDVFYAQKGVIDNFLKFCKTHSLQRYINQKEKIYTKFTYDCIGINGPITWINLRYKGNYVSKVKKIFLTVQDIIKLNPSVLKSPKFYFVLIANLISPPFITKTAHKIVLKYYLNQK